jgi:hypothetical protein
MRSFPLDKECTVPMDFEQLQVMTNSFMEVGNSRGVIASLSAFAHLIPANDTDNTVRAWALEVAMWAVVEKHAEVVPALAATAKEGVRRSLSARHARGNITVADMAAAKDSADVITELANTGIGEVLDSLSAPHPGDGFTPAQRAAHQGHGEVIAALARIDHEALQANMAGPDADGDYLSLIATRRGHPGVIYALANSGRSALQATLSARHLDCTPAQLAAVLGEAKIITALANTGLEEVQASLSERLGDAKPLGSNLFFSRHFYPVQLAAQEGHTKVIRALAATGIAAVLESFSQPGVDGHTSASLARLGGFESTAKEIEGAIKDAASVPEGELGFMEKLHQALVGCGQHAENLVMDTRCSITMLPFATCGTSRPVYLVHAEADTSPAPKFAVSRQFASLMLSSNRPEHPTTRQPIDDWVEAPDRVALIRDLVEACRQNPDATPEDRVHKALSLYKAYSEPAAGVPCAERPLAQYETVLAAAAGAGAGPTPRRAAEP